MDDQLRTGRLPKVDRVAMKRIRKNARKKVIWTGKEMQDYPQEHRYKIQHRTHSLPVKKMGLHPEGSGQGACKQGIC